MQHKKIYWDSCIWIALFNKEDGRFENIYPIFKNATNGEVKIYTSIASLVEVAKTRRQFHINGHNGADGLDSFEGVFGHEAIIMLQLELLVAQLARKFVQRGMATPMDAIHLASACQQGCEVIYTYDDRILKLHGKTSPEGHPLTIMEPPPPDEPFLI